MTVCRRAEAQKQPLSLTHPAMAAILWRRCILSWSTAQQVWWTVIKAKLAQLAGVSEKSLRLTGLRPGSIIAELLVLATAVDDPLMGGFSAVQNSQRLRNGIAENAKELCALAGSALEGCNVEFKDLGIAKATVSPVPVESTEGPRQESKETETKRGKKNIFLEFASFEWCHCQVGLILGTTVAVLALLVALCCFVRSCRQNKLARYSMDKANDNTELEATASMEEGNALEKQAVDDEGDDSSTVTPTSDKHSEPSVCGDADVKDDEEGSQRGLAAVKALSEQSI
eukprot:gnl/MRDRNA2_/MRDRNA2_47389_c0_seq2.p1 gnl/MRDRNA2_/MRDRNA2_47389_c0~~gnl/MRDRNA2_/MRDRNA2_47389_c0_seq2.p1  ORF type:complete len:285 (+),score=70.39 gnl/MRDRNA2_/MRDRNA2_47389_c0_seq2:803-1657(+)